MSIWRTRSLGITNPAQRSAQMAKSSSTYSAKFFLLSFVIFLHACPTNQLQDKAECCYWTT